MHLVIKLWGKGRPESDQVETTARGSIGQDHQDQTFAFLKSQKSSRTKQLGTKYNYLYKPNCYVSDSPSLKFPTSLFKIKVCWFFFLLTQGYKTYTNLSLPYIFMDL